uniref:Uncharacterized protein n=1 Tax=Anguilla anguilla TaxID=7936 RepID=A0A0E9TDT6_ANGAN
MAFTVSCVRAQTKETPGQHIPD